ncbi:MAG: glycoside hydrolase [Clostridia bacterium]|nr:glycoside hydrolase [Clostridia bacterium]MBQ9996338.1 glycoside hydrolase [Clostridia bacterium]
MKIGVIGGAGVRTVIFINGLLKRYKKLNIDEVVLYDTDHKKLSVIAKLCRHVVNREGKDLVVREVFEAVDAIKDMDYIVTTLRVGGDHSRVIDESVALKNGVIGQETTGVGGFSMAVRTIPVLMEYCELIETYAPDAWIFNFTNPSGLVTQALHSAGHHRIIGICDAPSSMKYRMAQQLGVTEEELYVEFFGLNHLSWIKSVQVNGEEIMPKLIADDAFLSSIQELEIFDRDVIRKTGMLPNEYLYYYYHRERALANINKSDMTRGQTIEMVNIKMMEELTAMDIDADPEEALQIFLYYMQLRENSYMSIESGSANRPMLEKGSLPVPEGMGYAGVMLDCIEGMQSEEGRTLVLSILNQGCIPFLTDEDVVEVTCKVSKNGIEPVKQATVPAMCELYIRLIKHYERLTVEAVREGSEDKAVAALMTHPLINSYSLAKKLIADYNEAYGEKILGGNA